MTSQQQAFLQALSAPEARFKAVATLDSKRIFRQSFHLSRHIGPAIALHGSVGNDTYLSLCDFQTPKRSENRLFGLSGFAFDVDCHDSQDPASDALLAYEALQRSLFGTEHFPDPSMVQHTGRGLLVLIAFQRTPKQVLPLWRRMGEGFANALRSALPDFATLDATYSDVSRVVRVPGTHNRIAGCDSYLIDFQESPPIYELSALRDRYFPELHPSRYQSHEKGGKTVRPVPSAHRLHADRLADLYTLCQLRGYNMDGAREKLLFLCRYWTCLLHGSQQALQAIQMLNGLFTHPLTQSEVARATRSGQTAAADKLVCPSDGYNYRNETLIRWLDITEEEQTQLKTIISKGEKARRRAIKKQWGHQKRDGARAEKRRQRTSAIMACIVRGMSCREICKETGCSSKTVVRIAHNRCFPIGRSIHYVFRPLPAKPRPILHPKSLSIVRRRSRGYCNSRAGVGVPSPDGHLTPEASRGWGPATSAWIRTVVTSFNLCYDKPKEEGDSS